MNNFFISSDKLLSRYIYFIITW